MGSVRSTTPDWWTDTAFAKAVEQCQGSFVDFSTRMESLIVDYQEQTNDSSLIGYVRFLPLQGSEGPVWTISYSAFGFMPMGLGLLSKYNALLCSETEVVEPFRVIDLSSRDFMRLASGCAWRVDCSG